MTAEVKPGLVLMQQLFPREGETQPRHRFPEFQHAGNWEKGTLGSVCDLYQPVTLSSSELSMTGEHLVYGANGIIGTHNEYNHEDSEVAVTCRGATCGEVTITEPKSWITGNAMVVKPKTMKIRKDFIFHYFKNHGLKNVISGSAQPQITRAGFAPLVFFFPPPSEQQRIAECLSSADEAIAAQARKVDALKKRKKGLMQQLFPREGETKNCLPERRFPEFRNEAMWHPSELGSIAVILKGKGITKADLDPDGLQACIRYGELYTRYGEIISKVVSRTKVAPSQLFFSEPNDIIIPSSGETKIDIAKASCVLAGGIALGGDLNVIRTKLNGIFLSYYLNGPKRLDIAKVAQGDTVVHLYPHQLEALHIAVPSIAEQQRIASCLSSLDSLISAEIQKFDTLKIHKKSLMQQLFPPSKEAEK